MNIKIIRKTAVLEEIQVYLLVLRTRDTTALEDKDKKCLTVFSAIAVVLVRRYYSLLEHTKTYFLSPLWLPDIMRKTYVVCGVCVFQACPQTIYYFKFWLTTLAFQCCDLQCQKQVLWVLL